MEFLHCTKPHLLTKVVVVTGLDVEEIRRLFPDVCDTLGKPVVPNRLLRAVRQCVGEENFNGMARGCAGAWRPVPMSSISPRESGLLLDLPDDLVDALIASGRFLCHVRDGETRIPLDQLEAFFRDGLIRVIRAAAMVEPASQLRQRDQEEQEEKEEVIAAPAMVIEPAEVKKRNARHAPRFIPRRQIGGIFKDVKFSIVQISASGFRIRHNDPLIPGDDAKLTFALMNPPRSFLVRARVVWTSVAHYENDDANTFCISGLRVTAHEERVKNAIDIP